MAALLLSGLPCVAAAGPVEYASGSYVGDGTAGRDILNPFKPDFLIIRGDTTLPAVVATTDLPNGLVKELGTTAALSAGRVTDLNGASFTLGADGTVNAPGVTYYWTAFTTGDQMEIGNYNGNGSDDRGIGGVGFQPTYVMILPEHGRDAVQRMPAQSGDASFDFDSAGETTNRIQAFESNGFQVGSDVRVNESGFRYYYVAWAADADVVTGGSYVGDDSDNRRISTFRPDLQLIASEPPSTETVFRNREVAGDLTLPVPGSAPFPDGIQAFLSTGFEVGTDASVNEAGETYYWVAFRDPVGSDLDLAQAVDNPIPNEGDPVTYTVTLTNYGPENARNIDVSDTLPAGVTYQAHSPSQGSYDPGTGLWSVGDVSANTSVVLTLDATVDLGTAGAVIVNTATVDAVDEPDAFPDNDSASVAITVQAADLEIVKSVDDATPTEGEAITYTVTLNNLGPDPATGVSVSDILPPGVTYASSGVTQGSYVPGTGVWTVGAVAAGTSETLTLSVSVDPGMADSTIVNVAAVLASDQVDLVPGNGADSATVVVQPPGFRMTTGTYLGDGSDDRVFAGLGFQPDVVLLKGQTASFAHARIATMRDNRSKALGDVTSHQTNAIQSFDPDGFTIGSRAAVNANGTTFDYVAFRADPSRLAFGTYTGDDTDDRDIGGVGFQPAYVLILAEGTELAVQRFPSQAGDASLNFDSTDPLTNRIQALQADGFQVGSNDEVNGLGITYHWVAWKETAGLVAGGTYTGTATDNRPISSFRPDLLLLVQNGNSEPTIHRTGSMNGDIAVPLDDGVPLANEIQAFGATGFEVGSGAAANGLGDTYYWMAFRNEDGVDLELAKSVDNPAPSEGTVVNYTVTVTNYGPQPATGVSVTDLLPAGVTYQSHLPSVGTYTVGTGVWSVGNLANGASATLAITVAVDVGTAGQTITNSATVDGVAEVDAHPGNDAASVDIVIQAADLEVTTTVDDATPTVGETVFYRIDVTNLGPDPATGVGLRDVLPAGVTFASDSPTQGTYSSGTGDWSVGSLGSGGSATLILGAVVDPGTVGSTIVNTAAVTASDQVDPVIPNGTDSASILVQPQQYRIVTGSYLGDGTDARAISGVGFQPDVVILKGESLGAGVVRTKTMSGDAAKALDSAVPLGANLIESLDGDGFTVGTAAEANSFGVTYHWQAFLEAPGQMKVGSFVGDGVDDRDIAGVGIQPTYLMVFGSGPRRPHHRFQFQAGDACLRFSSSPEQSDRIQAFQPDGFQVGGDDDVNEPGFTQHYVAWGSVSGRVAAGLYLGDDLDDRAVTGVGFPPVHVTLSRLEDGSGTVLRPSTVAGDLTLPAYAGSPFSNAIQALQLDGFEIGSHPAVNSSGKAYVWTAFRDVNQADLTVSKTVSDSVATVGGSLTYVVTLTNNGPEVASGVEVTDLLPPGVTHQTHLPTQGTYSVGTGQWTVGPVGVGASESLTIDVTVNPGAGGSTVWNSAAVTAVNELDGAPGDEADSAAVRVTLADLQTVKAVDLNAPDEADSVTYTVTLRNLGPDDATGIAVADSLPAGTTYVTDLPSQGSYTPATGLWTVGSVAAGDSASLSLTAVVNAGTAGTSIWNIAGVSATDQEDSSSANNVDSVAVTVMAADLQLAKTVDLPQADEADTLTFTITLQNAGPDSSSGIQVTDLLPAGLTYV
ncbi:MAG: DUF11 domain-containing protein, partial [Gemmatimonadetes bacterium]|nr:DUF11 domain-containing protein [Gemmatimonadota bacterium]